MRDRGGVVNTAIAIGCGTGIVMSQDPTLLASNGGAVTLTKDWAKYLLRRMGFVKRRGRAVSQTDIEMEQLFSDLNLCGTKPAILSLIPKYSDNYITKLSLPTFPQPLTSLYQSNYMKLEY